MESTAPNRWSHRPSAATSTTLAPSLASSNDEKGLAAAASDRKRRKRLFLWLTGLCIIVVVAIALGVGLGVGLNKKLSPSYYQPSPSPTPTPSPTAKPHNPVKIASAPVFLGNVTSCNTPDDVRDLGFQGKIGDTWINTFGDTVPCRTAWPLQTGCFGIDASNSAGIPQNITSYRTVNAVKNRTRPFCPRIDGEPPGFGLGLTNVIETTNNTGIVYVLAINREKKERSAAGSGIGIVTFDAKGAPQCTRPLSHFWHPKIEPHYGDHSAVLDPDGYIYAYGGGRASDCPPEPQHCLNYLWLARVPQAQAAVLDAYEYWNGTMFTPARLYHPTIAQSVMYGGQGTVIWSPFYSMYMFFKPDCIGSCIVVSVSYRPEGPWSDTKMVMTSDERPSDNLALYTPVVQPKYSAADLSWMTIMYTGTEPHAGNILQSINVTFTK